MTNLVAAVWFCVASYERFDDAGHLAANGRPFNPQILSCACWRYPLGSVVKITDTHNGLSVVCTVTDRPARRFADSRIDLSPAAFERLNGLALGLCEVSVTLGSKRF